jgi:LuxR family maltose regulon positive regulatory protein
LNQRTEGWIAGLQLAALSLARQADTHDFIENFTGSNRYVLDYLFEEVFKGQPAKVQSFLLETSILKRLTPALCDALTGRSDSREQLERLEKANLFILPLDPSRRWYRYQHLFADLLLHLLRLSGDPSEADLHQRASMWYQENGQLEEAVRHALAGKNWRKAAELILVVDDELLRRGEVATLLRWFNQLPEETIQSEPSLCLTYAWALMLASKFNVAEKWLEWAEVSAEGNEATQGEIAAARAFMAQSLGDGPTLVKMSHKALDLLPEDDLNSRGMVAMNLGIAYWHMGQMEQAQEALEEAYPATRDSGNTFGETATRDFLGRILAVRGQLRQAAGIFEAILDQAGGTPIFPLVYLDMCALHYEWNQLDTASQYLEQYLGASQRGGNLEFQIAGYMQKARLRLAYGDASGALEALEQIHRLEGRGNLPERTLARSIDMQVQVALRLGDQEMATRLSPHLRGESEAHNFYRHLGLTPARAKLSQGRLAEAAEELAAAAQTAKENGWGYGLIAALVLGALAAEDRETGIGYLEAALDLAMPERFIQTFSEAGVALVPLLKEAAQRGIHTSYVGEILNTFGVGDRGAALATTSLVEPLSQRELEVLRLVAAGLSNREIAEKLFVSTGTVKTHIHNIYGKLEVANRTQAATRARELNLV